MSVPGAEGRRQHPSVAAELLHFFGEVEVVFGLWALVLLAAMVFYVGWEPARHYFNDGVNYTEAALRRRDHGARLDAADHRVRRRRTAARGQCRARHACGMVGGDSRSIGPMLGSFITEPAAMTICALLLGRQFYDLAAKHTAEVRDARAAFCERFDWRHAHALRRAARADGRAALGLDDRASCSDTSAGAPCWRSSCRRWPTS